LAAAELNSVLWRERELLESLLFFLETEQLMLAGGRTRWLARTSAEIEQTTAALRETEIVRAVVADRIAAELGLGADPSLSALAAAADEPWTTILDDQREAFLDLTTQIGEAASANRAMLAVGQRRTREALLSLPASRRRADTPSGSAAVASISRTRLSGRRH
jgi:hypothetical protein